MDLGLIAIDYGRPWSKHLSPRGGLLIGVSEFVIHGARQSNAVCRIYLGEWSNACDAKAASSRNNCAMAAVVLRAQAAEGRRLSAFVRVGIRTLPCMVRPLALLGGFGFMGAAKRRPAVARTQANPARKGRS